MIGARPAEGSDGPDLERLRGRALSEIAARSGGHRLSAIRSSAGLSDLTAIVGTVGDAVVGYSLLGRRGDVSMIEEIYVEPEMRGVGVGHELLELAAATAMGWGCSSLESVALPGDRNTKNFFEAHGMASRLLQVGRELP